MRVLDLYKVLDDEFTVSIVAVNENNTEDEDLVFVGHLYNAPIKIMRKEIKQIVYSSLADFRIKI